MGPGCFGERMDPQTHLMLRPDSARREDLATDVGLGIVAEGGLAALTPKAVAVRSGCTRQAVHQWFGGHEELRRVVANVFGVRWRRWVEVRVHADGLIGLLPDSEQTVAWCRVWLAVVEHAPRDQRIAAVVDAVRYAEHEVIATDLGCASDSDRVGLVHSVVDGLRLHLCAADPDLPGVRAERILAAATQIYPDFSLLDVKQGEIDVSSTGGNCPA